MWLTDERARHGRNAILGLGSYGNFWPMVMAEPN
jgi:hypothetical protein